MTKACRCLSMALFHNPLSCQERFLRDKAIAEEWRKLRDQTNTKKAWVELPFVLWKEGRIVINGKPDQFERFMMEEIEKANRGGGNSLPLGIQFIRLLYLAESHRQRQDRDGKMMDYRRWMQGIDPAKYAEYMITVFRLEKNN